MPCTEHLSNRGEPQSVKYSNLKKVNLTGNKHNMSLQDSKKASNINIINEGNAQTTKDQNIFSVTSYCDSWSC